MASTSQLLKDTIRFIFEVGPVRFWRWTVALFYPLFLAAFTTAERLWVATVQDQNHKTLLSQARSRVLMTKDKDLMQSLSKLKRV